MQPLLITGGDEDSDEDSDDGSDFSESEEESESEAGGLDLDACPPGCDQTIYDSTCMLREKRLDVEEALAEEKKNRDAMVKDLENMHKKAKVIEAASKAAEQELEAFQVNINLGGPDIGAKQNALFPVLQFTSELFWPTSSQGIHNTIGILCDPVVCLLSALHS